MGPRLRGDDAGLCHKVVWSFRCIAAEGNSDANAVFMARSLLFCATRPRRWHRRLHTRQGSQEQQGSARLFRPWTRKTEPGEATAPDAANYSYETPGTFGSVSGNWSRTSLRGEALNFSVSGAGVISGTAASNCTYTGTSTPRCSGKNVLDVTVTFGPAPCKFSGLT